jgi:hypothetical protein
MRRIYPTYRSYPTALLALALAVALGGGVARAAAQEAGQQGGGGRGQFAGMQRMGGEVTAVNGATITVKTEDGSTLQIVTTDNTRMMKGQGVTVKVAEVKAGDGVMAAGNLDAPNKTLHAAMLFVTDAEQVKKLRENMGKTYIAGKVTAIDVDNLKMTVQRQDGVSQVIGFDETTSFKRGARGGRGGGFGVGGPGGAAPAEGGESITLGDIKVGDNVMGQGAIKGGVFVPGVLNVMTPRAPRGSGGPVGPAGSPPASPPATPQQ